MLTIINKTPSTIKVIGTIVGTQCNCKIIKSNEKVKMIIKNYRRIFVKSRYGKSVITTFEDLSSIVNYGKLWLSGDNETLIATIKNNRR